MPAQSQAAGHSLWKILRNERRLRYNGVAEYDEVSPRSSTYIQNAHGYDAILS